MYDALYPDAAEAGMLARASRPAEPPKGPGWFDNFWGAVGKAPARGALESARALKTVTPMQVGNPLAMSSTEQEDMLRQEGITRRAVDESLARGIKEMTPDPSSTGAASMILHDVTRFVGKAVGYGAAAGPVGAVAGMGLDEGYNEAARRLDQGVDPATAAKLGAVHGVASAVAVAMPVAGKTLAQTAGLAAVGGPGSFIAEQATARAILEAADYEKLAAEIDPFDPLGLSVSALGSFGFGAAALAMRRARAKPEAPAGARAEPASEGAPPAREQPPATVETVDAAHVAELQARREAAALDPKPEAAAAHADALARASEQIAAGERVEVRDIAPVAPERLAEVSTSLRERIVNTARGVTQDMLSAAQQVREFVTGPAADPRAAGKVNFAEVSESAHGRILEQTGLDVATGARQEVRADAVRHAQNSHPDLTPDDWAALPWLAENFDQAVLLKPSASAQGPRIALAARDPATGMAYVAEYHTGKGKGGNRLSLVTFFRDHPNAVQSYLSTNARDAAKVKEIGKGGEGGGGTPDAPMLPKGSEVLTSETASGGSPIVPPEGGAAPAGPAESAVAKYLADEAQKVDPNLMVQMEGMDAPVRAADLLAEVQAQASREVADAPLLRVAAECFLRG